MKKHRKRAGEEGRGCVFLCTLMSQCQHVFLSRIQDLILFRSRFFDQHANQCKLLYSDQLQCFIMYKKNSLKQIREGTNIIQIQRHFKSNKMLIIFSYHVHDSSVYIKVMLRMNIITIFLFFFFFFCFYNCTYAYVQSNCFPTKTVL